MSSLLPPLPGSIFGQTPSINDSAPQDASHVEVHKCLSNKRISLYQLNVHSGVWLNVVGRLMMKRVIIVVCFDLVVYS